MLIPHKHALTKKILLTPQLRDLREGILLSHPVSGLALLQGPPGVGKTTLALHMVDGINSRSFPEVDERARALYMVVTGDTGARGMKNGVYRLHVKVIGELKPSVLRARLPDTMIGDVVATIIRKELQFIFLEEAVTLSSEELRGVVAVSDEALLRGWPLTIVLLGPSRNLLRLVRSQEQIESRVLHFAKMNPWGLKDSWELMHGASERFPPYDLKKLFHMEYMSFLHDATNGLPRRMRAVLKACERRFAQEPEIVVDLALCTFIVKQLQENGWRDAGTDE